MSEGTELVGGGAIHASPTKDFFVTMITRDIPLADCIFDLIDNSIDAARRQLKNKGTNSFDGFYAHIEFDKNTFTLKDNCGGISLSDAIDHAFHFGRKRNSSQGEGIKSIGLYGIGMKRAIFKMGRYATVESETEADSFEVVVDVEAWEKNDDDWDFNYKDRPKSGVPGASISISKLQATASNTFEDPTFKTELLKLLARDYAFVIASGFEIKVKGASVPKYSYELKQSDAITPALVEYVDEGVSIRIVAGLVDELSDEIPEELRPGKVDRYGWFVVCNDRVVMAADKTDKTVWGDDGFRMWHPQYNGFAGFIFFVSDDAKKLPWTTTKREVDISDPIYRRAIGRMKEVTSDFVEYTNRRKGDLDAAKVVEQAAAPINISSIFELKPMAFPLMQAKAPKKEMITISYSKPTKDIREVAAALGQPGMSAREVGRETFDYFRRVEMGK